MGVDVAADGGNLALDFKRTRKNGHYGTPVGTTGILAQSDTMLSLQDVEDAADIVYAAMPPTRNTPGRCSPGARAARSG